MGLRKFRADTIFDGYRFLEGDNVLITDDKGVVMDIIARSEAGSDFEQFNGILSPGFINCHCHLELSHMKGLIPERTGLVKFVVDVVQQRHFPEEQILQAIKNAEEEMLANGIVAAGDICNNNLTIPQKSKGRLYYHNFIEASGFDPTIAVQRFERARSIYEQYSPIAGGAGSIVPHAPYSVADELWELIVHFPGNHVMTIHNQETEAENEWFVLKEGGLKELYSAMNIDPFFFKPSGKSSLQTYLYKFLPGQSVILVHNVHTSEEDLLFSKLPIVNCQLFWCLCPNANQYITGQLPPVDLMIKHNCEIVLGTDSLASNHQLSILEEIKTIQKNFRHIEIETMLRWATSNGAKALQMDGVLGSFDPSTSVRRKPGIVLIESDFSSCRRLA